MTESFLEKLKKSVLQGAHTSATKIEEAARAGKLHLDLMAERRKLTREYTELGKEAHLAFLEGGTAQLGERPGVADMHKNIEKYKLGIVDLEARLAASQKRSRTATGTGV
ncbi:MAG TPA: hypothetical protein VK465_18710 [Fibrobacteria bacterium]|nr:hypothetical protein [Fibrobacteria bacterium]